MYILIMVEVRMSVAPQLRVYTTMHSFSMTTSKPESITRNEAGKITEAGPNSNERVIYLLNCKNKAYT